MWLSWPCLPARRITGKLLGPRGTVACLPSMARALMLGNMARNFSGLRLASGDSSRCRPTGCSCSGTVRAGVASVSGDILHRTHRRQRSHPPASVWGVAELAGSPMKVFLNAWRIRITSGLLH
jgi:hypothetical protein